MILCSINRRKGRLVLDWREWTICAENGRATSHRCFLEYQSTACINVISRGCFWVVVRTHSASEQSERKVMAGFSKTFGIDNLCSLRRTLFIWVHSMRVKLNAKALGKSTVRVAAAEGAAKSQYSQCSVAVVIQWRQWCSFLNIVAEFVQVPAQKHGVFRKMHNLADTWCIQKMRIIGAQADD